MRVSLFLRRCDQELVGNAESTCQPSEGEGTASWPQVSLNFVAVVANILCVQSATECHVKRRLKFFFVLNAAWLNEGRCPGGRFFFELMPCALEALTVIKKFCL